MLYLYKCTNTDTLGSGLRHILALCQAPDVSLDALVALCYVVEGCETLDRYSLYLLYWYKKVQILSQKEGCETLEWHSIYLLYWYKSTNTD